MNEQKLLGKVYTPPIIAKSIVNWTIRKSDERVLDPSCGEGIFIEMSKDRLVKLGAEKPDVIGVDIDENAAKISGAIYDDFFSWADTNDKRDAIVGNPPYVRSHLFSRASKNLAFEKMRELGFKPKNMMSTWAAFLAICCEMLSKNGRIGMVLPEELLYVQYASELREYLLKNFNQIIISPANNNKFWNAQQSPIILLADRSSTGKKGLFYLQYSDLIANRYNQMIEGNNLAFIGNKWSHLLLEKTEIELLNNVINKLNWKSLSEYGTVCIGVVTGKNDYFILNKSESKDISDDYLKKIVCNAKDLKGIRFTENDFEYLTASERPTYLLSINDEYEGLPKSVKNYLKKGEELNIYKGYKCSIRDQWFSVPSTYNGDAFFLRQSGKIPRIVNSDLSCTCTDTLHRIKWKDKKYGDMLAVEFLNSVTLISCNLLGRSYGGGVLTILPSEANSLLVPKPISSILDHEQYIDDLIRKGNIWQAIYFIDRLLLAPICDDEEIIRLEKILRKLIDRRAKK